MFSSFSSPSISPKKGIRSVMDLIVDMKDDISQEISCSVAVWVTTKVTRRIFMGFDNNCVVSIQSLAGEYCCPLCRMLVYPDEALQSQCGHLYCKRCLAYVVSTTRACPYDGYLVTEADSKPLVESNKTLAESIGKASVRCLYYISGCTWQGQLSECTTHCTGCTFGNSQVLCNRCATQMVHRKVHDHTQHCPGVQPQAQQADGNATKATGATSNGQLQAAAQATATVTQTQDVQAQTTVQAVPTPEQWYQLQPVTNNIRNNILHI